MARLLNGPERRRNPRRVAFRQIKLTSAKMRARETGLRPTKIEYYYSTRKRKSYIFSQGWHHTISSISLLLCFVNSASRAFFFASDLESTKYICCLGDAIASNCFSLSLSLITFCWVCEKTKISNGGGSCTKFRYKFA